jgi:hypothetical protein
VEQVDWNAVVPAQNTQISALALSFDEVHQMVANTLSKVVDAKKNNTECWFFNPVIFSNSLLLR